MVGAPRLKPFRRLAAGETARFAYLDLVRDAGRSIFVAGDGRSGTTWLADILNFDNQYRYMFEPFHPTMSPVAKGLEFFQYLPPDDECEFFRESAVRVLTGRYRDYRVDHLNRRHLATKRVIKDIFANLMLAWLKRQFPQLPIVMIVRHPCAVAVSKMAQRDSTWGVKPSTFLRQTAVMADHLEPFRALIDRTDDEFEMHILNWCIVHYIPLRQFRRGELHVIAYEHLCDSREYTIRRMFDFLGLPFRQEAVAASQRPSATITEDSAVVRRGELLASWQRKVGTAQRARALEIMQAFGLDLYSDDPMPVIDDFNSRLAVPSG